MIKQHACTSAAAHGRRAAWEFPVRFAVCLSVIVVAATLGGCARPEEPVGPSIQRVTNVPPEAYPALYEAAATTLRQQFYRLDRQDRGEGVITTHPETSAGFFELWRPQPEPGYYWWESNFGTIERQVTVRLTPAAQPDSYDVQVEVQRLRYTLLERQVDNAAAALRLYSGAVPTSAGRFEHPNAGKSWIALGRDEFAEKRTLSDIINRYAKMPPTTQPAATSQPASTSPGAASGALRTASR